MGKSDALSRRADHGTGGEITAMFTYSTQSSLQRMQSGALSELSPEGENIIFSVIFEAETNVGKQEDAVVKAAEELQQSKGNLSERRNGLNTIGLLCFRDRIYIQN